GALAVGPAATKRRRLLIALLFFIDQTITRRVPAGAANAAPAGNSPQDRGQLAASPATVSGTPSKAPTGRSRPSVSTLQPCTRWASASIAYRNDPSRVRASSRIPAAPSPAEPATGSSSSSAPSAPIR